METTVKYLKSKKPTLNKPVLIEGLPGFGQVGRLVSEHLVKEFKGTLFAELYSPHFPPQVMIRNDGFVDMINTNFYVIKNNKLKHDLIVAIGESQAATIRGQYDICEKILDVAKDFNVKEVVTVGGYATGKLLKEPKVYGAATHQSIIDAFEKHGVIFKTKGNRGSIIGVSGLLLGLSKMRNMKAVCLMGETPGHPLLIDAKAAEAVLRIFGKYIGKKIPMEALDKRAKELEKFRVGLEKMMHKMMSKEATRDSKVEEEENENLKYIG